MIELKQGMLPALARESETVVECLNKVHINCSEKQVFPITFRLGQFFDAVWIWAQSSGLSLPTGINYKKYFDEFCEQLMQPWPIEAFDNVGLKIRNTHISNSKVNYRYEVSRIDLRE